ncbi:MAG TPA: tRNA (adenosine(37)-N6)-threonylcarbamoyltransferase complex dimerization subunit type 1 TsaB [Dehalococcoidia bacterium]|nr:tRNA (adenosine(37)-N6)-threonylcarbamoyltransferase complex dimerization subunit type 1 TsaB [Dehalococcoidia bacterium]
MELSIDTASELASLALSQEGELRAEVSWLCRRNQTAELLPTLERLLAQMGASKRDLTAVFVSLGPGMYTGLRVGISVAQGLAFALKLPAAGVGRLELDALAYAASDRPILPVHTAGRGELAWAVYEAVDGGVRELRAPGLSLPETMLAEAPANALFCGEVKPDLAEMIREKLPQARIAAPPASGRAALLARAGYRRLLREGARAPGLLRPIYLREAVADTKSG